MINLVQGRQVFTNGKLTDKMMLINLPSAAKTSAIRPKSASKSGGPTTHEQIVKRAKRGVKILGQLWHEWPGKMN